MHEIAPQYSTLEKNCYWFCHTLFDACKVIYGRHLEDDDNPHWDHSEILGRWNGLKVSETKREELSEVVHKFKRTYCKVISEVKKFLFFQLLLFFTNYEQISNAQDDREKVAFVNTLMTTQKLVWQGKLKQHVGKFDKVTVCTQTCCYFKVLSYTLA